MKTKPLDIEAHADGALSAAPAIDAQLLGGSDTALLTAPEPVEQTASQPLFPVEASQRHGRIAGRSLGIGYNRATGKDLEADVADTAGEAMGEVFAAVSGMGNRLLYWLLLIFSLVPVVLVVVRELTKATKESSNI